MPFDEQEAKRQLKFARQRSTKARNKLRTVQKESRGIVQHITDTVFSSGRVRGKCRVLKRIRRRDHRVALGRKRFKAMQVSILSGVGANKNNGRGRYISAESGIGIASSPFTNSAGMAGVARALLISKDTCRRQVVQFSRMLMLWQRQVLKHLSRAIRERGPDTKILYGLSAIMFDETLQHLRLPVAKVLRTNVGMPAIADIADADAGESPLARSMSTSVKTPMQICVARQNFQWAVAGADGNPQVFTFEPYIPPFCMTSNSSKNLWKYLRGHEWMLDILQLKDAILTAAAKDSGLTMDLFLNDNASGNDKLFAAGERIDPASWCRFQLLCQNHQNHICLMSIFACQLTLTFFGTLYGLATFCRMGVHMMMFCISVGGFLEQPDVVVVRPGVPFDEDISFRDQIISYLLTSCGHPPESKARRDYETSLQTLFSDWNSCFHLKGKLVHTCSGRTCCSNGLPGLRKRLAASLRNTMLRGSPPTPQAGKWLQLGLFVDWCMLAFVCNLFGHLMVFKSEMFSSKSDPSKEYLEGFGIDVEYYEVRGQRYKQVSRNLADDEWRVKVMIIAIVIEPVRFLTHHYLNCSFEDISASKRGYAPAVSLINPAASLIIAVLQYLSLLIRHPSSAPRLRIIYCQRGCRSFEAWLQSWPGDVDVLRCSAMVLLAQIWRRQWFYLSKELEVLTVSDRRLNDEHRNTICTSMCSRRSCCLRPGPTRHYVGVAQMHAKQAFAAQEGKGVDVVRDNEVPIEMAIHFLRRFWWSLHCMSWFLRLSTALIERLHTMNRCLALHGCTDPASFSAMSVNALFSARFREAKMAKAKAQPQPKQQAARVPRRALSPFECFRKRCLADDRAHGVTSLNPANGAKAADFRNRWRDTSDAERTFCEALSLRSKAEVDRNRIQGPAAPAPLTDDSSTPSSIVSATPLPLVPATIPVEQICYRDDVSQAIALPMDGAEVVKSTAETEYGVAPQLVKNYRQGIGVFNGQGKRTQEQDMQHWSVVCSTCGGEAPPYPEVVSHPTCCGEGLCDNDADIARVR